MTDGNKEKIRLTAAYLNGMAISLFAVGGLAFTLQLVLIDKGVSTFGAILYLFFVAVSVGFHCLARLYIGAIDHQ